MLEAAQGEETPDNSRIVDHGRTALHDHPDAAFFCSEVAAADRARQVVGYCPIVPPRFTSDYVSPAAMRREIQRKDNWLLAQASSIGAVCLPRSAIRSARFATAWRSGFLRFATDSILPPRFSRPGWSIRKACRRRRLCR